MLEPGVQMGMASFRSATFQGTRNSLRLAFGLLALAAPLATDSAFAEPYYSPQGAYGARLEDESGSALRTFYKDGTTFVLGYQGERFAIRLSNHTSRRVEAVVSVDGPDAVSGRMGDYVRERGYVLPPYGTVLVEGFRTSYDAVAAFRFTNPHDSYSARMGTPENVGVIGVAFFPERPAPAPLVRRHYRWSDTYGADEAPPPPQPYPSARANRSEKKGGAPRASAGASLEPRPSESDAASAPSRLGTEYAESRQSRVTEIPFQRESATRPAAIVRLRYDDAAGLEARGIDVYPERYWGYSPPSYPEAFPGNRFAPPPP